MESSILSELLVSIEADSLILFCGAGLSMSPPSNLPSAADLAKECTKRYITISGSDLPNDIKDNLEKIASYCKQNGIFKYFIQKLIPWDRIMGIKNNSGHDTIADFLCCSSVDFVVTTNQDDLIEIAASNIGENNFYPAVLPQDLFRGDIKHNPYLKLHGCCRKDRESTIWCKEQLEDNIIKERIKSFTKFMDGRLPEHDIIILGFWSDWDYLNSILWNCISNLEPRTIFLVDPLNDEDLSKKAPDLWNWVNSGKVKFIHIHDTGDGFLSSLRKEYSINFLKRLINESINGQNFRNRDIIGFLDENIAMQDLYNLRRNFTGVPANKPVRDKKPEARHQAMGYYHALLIEKGAKLIGTKYNFNDKKIRIINKVGELLSKIKKDFSNEEQLYSDIDITICIGATDDSAPSSIVRGNSEINIVRTGVSGKWITDKLINLELGIN